PGFAITAVGGIAIGYLVGRASVEVLRRVDDPPVEVVISLLIPFAAYLPADRAGLSGVLAVVTAGFIIGRRLGTVLSPSSRTMWFVTWKMVGFVLNGLAFVLIGLKLPDILTGVANRPPLQVLGLAALVWRGSRRSPPLGLRLRPDSGVAAPADCQARSSTGLAADVPRRLDGASGGSLAGRRPGAARQLPA